MACPSVAQLDDTELLALAPALASSTSLTTLTLAGNPLTSAGVLALMRAVRSERARIEADSHHEWKLIDLDLSRTRLGHAGQATVGDAPSEAGDDGKALCALGSTLGGVGGLPLGALRLVRLDLADDAAQMLVAGTVKALNLADDSSDWCTRRFECAPTTSCRSRAADRSS